MEQATTEQEITATLRPNPGRQTQFLANKATICIYGGAAGGGKSEGLLLEAIRHHKNPNFNAVYFRRKYPQITGKGGIWGRTYKIFPLLGGEPNNSDLYWRFPSGAHVGFSHLQHEHNMYDHQSSEYPLILWDELTQFTEAQFWFLEGRNRSTCGVKPYIRGACNPDPDSFVKKLILPWLDENGQFANPKMAGQIRWMVRDRNDDSYIWYHEHPEKFETLVYKLRREDL